MPKKPSSVTWKGQLATGRCGAWTTLMDRRTSPPSCAAAKRWSSSRVLICSDHANPAETTCRQKTRAKKAQKWTQRRSKYAHARAHTHIVNKTRFVHVHDGCWSQATHTHTHRLLLVQSPNKAFPENSDNKTLTPNSPSAGMTCRLPKSCPEEDLLSHQHRHCQADTQHGEQGAAAARCKSAGTAEERGGSRLRFIHTRTQARAGADPHSSSSRVCNTKQTGRRR